MTTRKLLTSVTIILLATFAYADDATPDAQPTAQPRSVQAKEAETKFNLDIQKLNTDYQQKATAIRQAYVDGLKNALKTLAKGDNPDPAEIGRLSAKIKEVQESALKLPVLVLPDFKWLEGTEWRYSTNKKSILTFGPNHILHCPWSGSWSWSVADQHTVSLKMRGDERVVYFTLNSRMDLGLEDGGGPGFWKLIK